MRRSKGGRDSEEEKKRYSDDDMRRNRPVSARSRRCAIVRTRMGQLSPFRPGAVAAYTVRARMSMVPRREDIAVVYMLLLVYVCYVFNDIYSE
jgi:hypothetical protein